MSPLRKLRPAKSREIRLRPLAVGGRNGKPIARPTYGPNDRCPVCGSPRHFSGECYDVGDGQ